MSASPAWSVGWMLRNAGADMIPAITGPRAMPTETHHHQGNGVTARTPRSRPPATATSGAISMPGTQAAATVDSAMVTISKKMTSADQSVAVGLRDGEVVEDQPVLAQRTVRLEECAARVVGDEADLAAAAVNLRRHGRGQADRVLDRRLLALAEMHLAVQVEEDPDVGRERLLEGLRHQPAVMRGERPVDAAEAVPGRVVAH